MNNKPAPTAGSFVGMGVSMALCVVAGVGGGHWLDVTLKTGLVFTFVGLLLGVAAGAAVVYVGIRHSL